MPDSIAETGALTVDAAAGLLGPEPEENEEAAPVEAEAKETPEPEAEAPEGASEAEAPEGEDPEPDPEEPEAVAEPALDPPPFWKPEDKADFAELPRKLQEKLRAYEDDRTKVTAQTLQQSAEARKAASAEAAKLAELAPKLAAVADQAQAMFERPVEGLTDGQGNPLQPFKWSEVNWPQWHKTDPLAATMAWTRYQAEAAEVQQIQSAKQLAQQQQERTAYDAYIQEEHEKLATVNPKLATDQAERQKVGNYLISRGYPPEAIGRAGALDFDTAHKAMLYDQLQAKVAQQPKPGAAPPRTPQAQSKAVRPSAAVPAVPPQKRAATEAANRFAQTGNIDDAVAALNARGSG